MYLFHDRRTFPVLPTIYGRPASLDALIQPTVEDSEGETAIIACGVTSFVAEVRNYTASLSDEKAVHKHRSTRNIFVHRKVWVVRRRDLKWELSSQLRHVKALGHKNKTKR